jgi:hypothetical protein
LADLVVATMVFFLKAGRVTAQNKTVALVLDFRDRFVKQIGLNHGVFDQAKNLWIG